ncbi:MAG: prolipoprotein diacylglyceryl transferase [Anaerolineae bacterium]
MFPTFARVLGESVPAYFTMLMTGFVLATYLGARWAKRTGLDHDVVIDLGLIAVLAGVAGARILHVVADGYFWDYVHMCTDPSRVVWTTVASSSECAQLKGAWDAVENVCRPAERDCLAWARFWSGGLTYYGGLVCAAVVGVWFLKRERFPLGKGMDMAGMVIPVGLFFGRLGCFFGGCCFGQATDRPIGVSFPANSPASVEQFEQGLIASKNQPSLPVHPTQLYESGGCLLIALALALWVHPRKRFDGQVFCLFLVSYAALRFVLEFFRADDRGGMLGLSTSQLIGIAAVAAAAWLWAVLARRARRILAGAD